MRKPKILSVKFEQILDESPDLSFLGEYSDTPETVHIDRKERGDMQRNELRYFNLGTGDAEYIEADYERMESYNNGNWHMTGCIAKAEVQLAANGPFQTIRSGGLWGVESDADSAYLDQIRRDELNQLYQELERLGCTDKQIQHAFENIDE